jgi:hypothetical protein
MVVRPHDPSRRLDRIRAIGPDSGACHRRDGCVSKEGRGVPEVEAEPSTFRLRIGPRPFG